MSYNKAGLKISICTATDLCQDIEKSTPQMGLARGYVKWIIEQEKKKRKKKMMKIDTLSIKELSAVFWQVALSQAAHVNDGKSSGCK